MKPKKFLVAVLMPWVPRRAYPLRDAQYAKPPGSDVGWGEGGEGGGVVGWGVIHGESMDNQWVIHG